MSKYWKLKPIPESVMHESIGCCADLPFPLARALALRNLHDADEIKEFLTPRLSNLTDPFLLPDMKKAVFRIWEAIDTGEIITVFGDYDVDGVTSTALLNRILSALGATVKPFIPSRLNEGYGLSQEALERCLQEHQTSLLITVDCGVNAVDGVGYAQSHGVDVIVTDHHEPDEQVAPAFALINPKLGTIPALENLSGVGVVFKLAHALLKVGRERGNLVSDQIDLRDYLDLVALGTVTDLVPLSGENRIIVRHGLAQLNRTKWEGLRALKAVAGICDEVDTYHLGFQLGPRINAVGRIGQPMQALRLLVTDDPAEAREIAELLDRTNIERRKIESNMAEQAFAEIDAFFDPEQHFGLVVAQKEWHPGVVGIVASRISRHYNRPAIVMGIDSEGKVQGSCRSIDAFDVLEGLRTCEEWLIQFGGHKMAAGLSLSIDSLEAFKRAFNLAAAAKLKSCNLAPIQHIDSTILGTELDGSFYEQLKQMSPFGQNNSEPIWALQKVEISGRPFVVGKKHLKLTVSVKGRKFEAIAFNYPLDRLPSGKLDIAFTLNENRWKGRIRLQLQIKDIRPAQALEI